MKNSICITLIIALAGCSGLTQIQDTVSRFDQGAHSVATGQMKFFRQVQIADCNNQFYSAAFKWALNNVENLDLSGECMPSILDDKQIKNRQALMDSITLYVDTIQALATNDNNKTLDSNSQNLAARLNGMARSHGFANISLAAEAEAAVIAITEMALDQRKFKDITSAATAMSSSLLNIVENLKAENSTYAISMAGKMDQIQIQLKTALVEARNASAWEAKEAVGIKGTSARSFLDVITAREILRSINPLGASPLTATQGSADRNLDPLNVAKELNMSLDSLVNANNALANAGTGGAIAAVNDLIARAQHANDILSAINR